MKRLLLIVFLTLIYTTSTFAHGGRVAADGWHNDRVNGGRHCHNKPEPEPEPDQPNPVNEPEPEQPAQPNIKEPVKNNIVEMPSVNFSSGLTGYYKVVRVYDGDTITIETPQGTTPSLRLVGVNTPEINADTQAEKNRAIAARDYLRNLILNKNVFITFEGSDTTLDGVERGPFCRPLSYIFIRVDGKNIFVNLEIVWQGHGEKYFKYPFDYQDFFRLDKATAQSRIDSLILTPPHLDSPRLLKTEFTTWANLKR